jgi:hypothetical protein
MNMTITIDNRDIEIICICPPIPSRCADWQAGVAGEYDEDSKFGYGATPDEAVQDLLWQLEE